jgi:hypothetical protein
MKNPIKNLDQKAGQWLDTIDARHQVMTGKGFEEARHPKAADKNQKSSRK